MVKPATTARPDTSAGAHSFEWQYGQTALGGWRSSPQSLHRWNRSSPSSPDVQKNLLVSVSSGSRRPDDSATVTPRFRRGSEGVRDATWTPGNPLLFGTLGTAAQRDTLGETHACTVQADRWARRHRGARHRRRHRH